jgi:8-oxo-dGTP pyrophosphatase MutT (NUDIX family)
MHKWVGAAGVCVNSKGQVLMVLQGKPEEDKSWSVPSGGRENDEALEECCIREVFEETGYQAKVVKKLKDKQGAFGSVEYTVSYFEIEVIGGTPKIQDPDGLIYDIAWKSVEQIKELQLSFPEDKDFLIDFIKRNNRS